MSRDILLTLIDPDPNQPRKYFDQAQLDELTDTIAANGLAQPILLRPAGDRFIIVHGERRFRAVRSLGWVAIPAEVRDIDPDQARWLALVENVQRADLSPIEEAHAYQSALAEGITQTDLGKRVGKSQSYIAQKLRLLGLPEPIRVLIDQGRLSEGHGRQLLRLKGDEYAQNHLAKFTATNGDSVADLKEAIDTHILLAETEATIERGFESVYQVCEALSEIETLLTRDERYDLYDQWLAAHNCTRETADLIKSIKHLTKDRAAAVIVSLLDTDLFRQWGRDSKE